MHNDPPAGIQRVTVRLAYQNPHAAIVFLNDAFGFPEVVEKRLEGSGGTIIVAEVSIGDAYMMIGRADTHGMQSPITMGASSQSMMVYVDDVDAHFAQAERHGALIVAPPTDQYWGDRRYEAKDCDGHLWFFHQRTKEVSQAEIDAIEASFRE